MVPSPEEHTRRHLHENLYTYYLYGLTTLLEGVCLGDIFVVPIVRVLSYS